MPMKQVGLTILGIVVGVSATFALVMGVEWYGSLVHPLPGDFDGSHEQMCRFIEGYPAWVLASVVPAWAVTGWAGVAAARKAGNRAAALVVGLLVVASLALNLALLPYPVWFKAGNLLAVPAACLLAIGWPRLGRGPEQPPRVVDRGEA